MAVENVRLADELERLRSERKRLMDGVDVEADSPADTADQAQRVEMRAEAERVDARIAEIEEAIHTGRESPADGTVGDGTVVRLRFDDGGRDVVRVGGVRVAADDTTVVTSSSPLGEALMGHRKGETVSYEAPAGEQHVTIESVAPAE